MALEDFTTYTEVDPTAYEYLVVTEHQVELRGFLNVSAYLYDDKGAGHFTDFTHHLSVMPDDLLFAGPFEGVWLLSNDVADIRALVVAEVPFIVLAVECQMGGMFFELAEYFEGTGYYDDSSYITADTRYYLMVKKAGTSLKVGIYSTAELRDAGDATDGDIDNLALTLHADYNFQYIFAANTTNIGAFAWHVSFINDLDLAPTPPPPGGASYGYIIG